MGVGKTVTLLAAAVAAGAVAVAMFAPHLALKVPNVGFILWVMMGQPLPGYFDPSLFQGDLSWLKSGDVVVSVGAKCGTNWMMTIVHELRTWDKPELRDFADITDVVPWAEFKHTVYETSAERISRWGGPAGKTGWDNPAYPFRAFKSHYFPTQHEGSEPLPAKLLTSAVLPVRERRDLKFIAMTRLSEDVLFSLFPFFGNHDEVFRAYWGGFPPAVKTFEEVLDLIDPEETIVVTDYIKQWWAVKDDPNVLLLHYADLSDPAKNLSVLRQIADFIGLKDIPEGELKAVAERTSIGAMKKKNDRYLYRFGDKMQHRIMADKAGSIIRAGGTGEFKKIMTPEQTARWEAHKALSFKNSPRELLEWYNRA